MSITLRHPVPGAPWGQAFGYRAAIPSIGLEAQLHNGQDLPAASGTPVLAARTGTVVWAGWDAGSGWGVRLRHTGGYETWYWHLRDQPLVSAGQRVVGGDQIAVVGSTGQWTTGPHLHFGLTINGAYVNPRPYIRTSSAPAQQLDSLGGIMAFYKTASAFEKKMKKIVLWGVPRATFNIGEKDAKGKPIIRNLAWMLRNLRTRLMIVQTRAARTEGKVDALGVAVKQLSGGKLDMQAIEKAAYEGAAKGAAEVSAAEVADQLTITTKEK